MLSNETFGFDLAFIVVAVVYGFIITTKRK